MIFVIKELSIEGFRGFGKKQTIEFAIPNGEKPGSGLSIIIGANNSGKTTVIEAIKLFNQRHGEVFFSEGRRNKRTNERVSITLTDENNKNHSVKTIETGGAATRITDFSGLSFDVVPSRRAFQIYFHETNLDKEGYIHTSHTLEKTRGSELINYGARIVEANKNKVSFNSLIHRILGNTFDWEVELSDDGRSYIKYIDEDLSYSGEGIGDGIWSVFTICVALFDSKTSDTIVIDEPELSVHPSVQKKLMQLFIEYSKDRQIIICTHSPYYVNWGAIANGASLIRISKEKGNSICCSIGNDFRNFTKGLLHDLHNPHVLGITATEALFIEDNIVLVEGQEDVVIYTNILKSLDIELGGVFFGWGAGGEPKMEGFLGLFHELGYKKVAVIYDGDKKLEMRKAQERYPEYCFCIIPEEDIRDKESRRTRPKKGIVDVHWKLKNEYVESTKTMFEKISNYFTSMDCENV